MIAERVQSIVFLSSWPPPPHHTHSCLGFPLDDQYTSAVCGLQTMEFGFECPDVNCRTGSCLLIRFLTHCSKHSTWHVQLQSASRVFFLKVSVCAADVNSKMKISNFHRKETDGILFKTHTLIIIYKKNQPCIGGGCWVGGGKQRSPWCWLIKRSRRKTGLPLTIECWCTSIAHPL